MVSKLTRLVGALFGSRSREEEPAEADARAIELSYSIDLPRDWHRVEANRSWNHLKARAPQGYAAIVVGSREDLIPEHGPKSEARQDRRRESREHSL
jgi:hypothetical protein